MTRAWLSAVWMLLLCIAQAVAMSTSFANDSGVEFQEVLTARNGITESTVSGIYYREGSTFIREIRSPINQRYVVDGVRFRVLASDGSILRETSYDPKSPLAAAFSLAQAVISGKPDDVTDWFTVERASAGKAGEYRYSFYPKAKELRRVLRSVSVQEISGKTVLLFDYLSGESGRIVLSKALGWK